MFTTITENGLTLFSKCSSLFCLLPNLLHRCTSKAPILIQLLLLVSTICELRSLSTVEKVSTRRDGNGNLQPCVQYLVKVFGGSVAVQYCKSYSVDWAHLQYSIMGTKAVIDRKGQHEWKWSSWSLWDRWQRWFDPNYILWRKWISGSFWAQRHYIQAFSSQTALKYRSIILVQSINVF